jgi:ribosomal-protein-alanine N-acetyltransferase
MSLAFMRALVAGDLAVASREIGAAVPPGMPDDLANFLRYRMAQVDADPTLVQWLGRGMVLTDEGGERRVIGTIGFHGAPDDQGRLEVGYRVEPEYRRRGFAREAIRSLFDWAAGEHGVRRFVASISPGNDASRALTASFGFIQTGSQMDEIDGLELVFEADWPPATRSVPGGVESP